ncbi:MULTISPECIES: hypothetical protein [Clostridium]|uniref:Transposase n=1 Tax=Clostridium frigoriphilum TaxID=443253 RepID=A0ABU7UXT3_9CLOT|nr:hypothetical protein [Clostridium sp. DSM 17811]MBU3100710.1 hypothetical protein [Clostridium sp. DSM 17811]
MNAASNYILTLKLNTEKYQEDILNKRLEISRSIYNSCLGELFKRYNHMRGASCEAARKCVMFTNENGGTLFSLVSY